MIQSTTRRSNLRTNKLISTHKTIVETRACRLKKTARPCKRAKERKRQTPLVTTTENGKTLGVQKKAGANMGMRQGSKIRNNSKETNVLETNHTKTQREAMNRSQIKGEKQISCLKSTTYRQ